MKPALKRLCSLALPAVLSAMLAVLPLRAHAESPGVSSELKSYRITHGSDGTDQRQPAAKAEAGAVIEYELTYTNRTSGPIRGLQATLPVPVGTTYVAASARPATVQASLDGKGFEPVPLVRVLKSPTEKGGLVKQPVPLGEYRFLRWVVARLEPGQSTVLVARVRINAPGARR